MNIVTVKINDFEYSLKGTEDAEYIASLAQYVNEKVASIKSNNNKLGTSELSVLAAVNIVDELFKFNVEYKKMKEQLQNIKDENKKIEKENEELKITSKVNIKNEEEYKREINELKGNIKNLERNIEEIQGKRDNKAQELENKYATEIKNLKEVHNKEFDNLKYKYNKDVETIRKECNNKIESMTNSHSNEVDNLKSKYTNEIKKYKNNMEFMEKTYLYKESAFKEKIHELEMKNIEENDGVIENLNKEIETLKDKLKKTMEQNNFMEKKSKMYVKEIKNLKNQNKEIRSTFKGKIK